MCNIFIIDKRKKTSLFYINFLATMYLCAHNPKEDNQKLLRTSRSGGMVDAADSKSAAGNSVWVRVPPPVQNITHKGTVHFHFQPHSS